MSKHTRRPKLDETLKKNEAFELEDGVYVFVKALSEEKHERKLEENAKFFALVGKLFEEIPDEVILESMKTLSVEEKHRHNAIRLPSWRYMVS